MTKLRCYRVWFTDGSAMLVDAISHKDARCKALKLTDDSRAVVHRTVCLDDEYLEEVANATKHTPGPDPLEGAVFRIPCGCDIVGDGTLPSPFSIAFCPRHAAAPNLLVALVDAEDFIERNLKHGQMDNECRTDLTEAIRRIRAAIAKVKET